MEKSSRISLRVTPEEKEAWEKAAGGSVSTWLRNLAHSAIENDVVFVPIDNIAKAHPRTKAECPRWMHHRPGVFCSGCGTAWAIGNK